MLRKRPPDWAINLALALGGVIIAALVAQVVITLFPGTLPSFLRPNVYDRRETRSDDLEADFLIGKGDLFVSQPGSVAPPPDPDERLVRFNMSFDEDGFRRPFAEAESYPIVALGDSYTEGVHVPKPWPDVLADELQTPVRNLGFQGYGPHDYAEVMSIHGTEEPRKWIVIGLFEGNDLSATISGRDEAFTLPDITRQAFLAARGSYTTPYFGEGPWKYPVEMALGEALRPFIPFEFHLWWVNGELGVYEESQNIAVLEAVLHEIKVEAGEACVLLAHIPSKSHIYFPYVVDEGVRSVLESSWEITLDEDDILTVVQTPTTRDIILARLGNLPQAVGGAAARAGVHFLDLSELLAEAAARGEEAYYVYDTHWNQHGHDIAGAAIADYIRGQAQCEI